MSGCDMVFTVLILHFVQIAVLVVGTAFNIFCTL